MNFLSILQIENAAFESVMGIINVVPLLGTNYMNLFPIILIVLCLSNIFDIFSKILNVIGIKQFQYTEHFDDETINEGKILLNKGILITNTIS